MNKTCLLRPRPQLLRLQHLRLQNSSPRTARRSVRSGVAMLELAIVLPIFLMLVLGIIEMGRVMMLNQMATNAAREGARRAIIPGMVDQTVMDIVNGYLDASGLSQTGREVKLMDSGGNEVALSSIGSHQEVTIRVEAPYAENTWGFTAIMGGGLLVSESTMRRE